MNIIVPDLWLREFLKTGAKPEQIAETLSLCAASVEKVEKVGNDYLYHVEITTNRVDMASVFGLAREAAAILPRFGFRAKLKPPPKTESDLIFQSQVKYLEVKIADPALCPRFTAILLENAQIKPSPPQIRQRLEKCGIRALNNVVDISNYLLLEMGQPMHTFDFDKISGQRMLMRLSKQGESIVTLDGVRRALPKDSIIIEDGKGRIIDLCGIMGGANSAISEKTKRVLLFVQTYDPIRIRATCQKLSFRTEAASLFEKGLDPENVKGALLWAAGLLEETTGGWVKKEVIDIYPQPYTPKVIKLELPQVEKILGVKIPEKEIVKILKSLGFNCQLPIINLQLSAAVPSFRAQDINIPEDLIEEIARLWGYHNLPSLLPVGELPHDGQDKSLLWEKRIKRALKYWGLTETYTYSMVSEEILEICGFNPQQSLKLANPLTEDLVYLRTSLIPSLLLTYQKNQYLKEGLHFFELSNVYFPQKNNLPLEQSHLCTLLGGEKFSQAKGIIEALFEELGIGDFEFIPSTPRSEPSERTLHPTPSPHLWHPGKTALIARRGSEEAWGVIGQIRPQVLSKLTIKGEVTLFDLDLGKILKLAKPTAKYQPLPKYPPVIEDLAVIAEKKVLTGEISEAIKSISPLIMSVSLWDIYEDTRTFRLTYRSPKKTLEDKEVGEIRQKVIENLKKKFGAQIKSLGKT